MRKISHITLFPIEFDSIFNNKIDISDKTGLTVIVAIFKSLFYKGKTYSNLYKLIVGWKKFGVYKLTEELPNLWIILLYFIDLLFILVGTYPGHRRNIFKGKRVNKSRNIPYINSNILAFIFMP